MADEPDDSDGRTVQMSADQLKRLHKELGLATGEDDAPPPKPAPKPIAPPPAARPAAPVSRTAATAEPPAVARAAAPAPEPEPEPEYSEPEPEPEPEYSEPEPEYSEPEPEYSEPEPEYPEPEPEPAPAPPPKSAKPAPAAKPAKVDKPAPPPKPPKPVKAPPPPSDESSFAEGGGGLCVIGGIGAIILMALAVLALLPVFGVDLGLDAGLTLAIGLGGGIATHLFLFLGMIGASRSTNGLATLVGVFHVIVAGLLAFILVASLVELEVGGDMVEIFGLLQALLPPTTLLLSGIWGFSAARGMGPALAGLYGTLAVVAGGTGLAVSILLRMQGGLEPDIAQILTITTVAATAAAALLLAIAMFGPLRRGPALS
ncbi:MAG: hypothetical protein IT385_30565 [Deltaproteobacteria bacterium]|nr:hypothetical protein [Deltaproteobacteria bacterium]